MKARLLFVFLLLQTVAFAQDKTLFQKKTFVQGTDSLPYRILMPANFDPAKQYPVVFFLHGRGESGTDNEKQLVHGSKLFLRDDVRMNFPAIVIFPQCPESSYWSNVDIVTDAKGKRSFNFLKGGRPTFAMDMAMKLLAKVRKESYVDQDRIYVGGLSMGGMGTFEILRRKNSWFAGAFAICGGDNVGNVKKYRNTPLWVFHGGKDDVVPPVYSELVVNELKKLGSTVKFTLYPNANHNSWDPAFAEPELLRWLFAQKR